MDLPPRWSTDLARQARRMGPLPYSAAGPSPSIPLPDVTILAPAAVDLLDRVWIDLGQPDPLTVVEVGAGEGRLAREVLRLGPCCLTALRYVLVESNPARRERQAGLVAIESPALVLGPIGREDDDEDETPSPAAGLGPLLTSLGELPHVDGPAIVLAVGFVSSLPSDRLERRAGRWYEIRLAADPAPADPALAADPAPAADPVHEVAVPLDAPRAAAAEELVGGPAPEPGQFAVHTGAVEWLSQALRSADSGLLVVVDHWTDSTLPLPPGRVIPVALDQLAGVRAPLTPDPSSRPALTEAGPSPSGEQLPALAVVAWRLG